MYKNSRSHSYCLHTYPQIRNKNVCFVSERHMKKNACWLYFGPIQFHTLKHLVVLCLKIPSIVLDLKSKVSC